MGSPTGNVRHIAVVTGSRAEYGLLYWPLRDLTDHPGFKVSLIVTGTHLSERHGHTVDAIERDQFEVARRVPLDLENDSPLDTARAVAAATAGCAEAIAELAPDMVLLLGDRFEILGAAQAATLMGVPLLHLCGGDRTDGAFDDAIRHAITKLAHVHLVSNGDSARRVRQLGEEPGRIHNVGNPGLDHIHRTRVLSVAELEESLGAPLGERNFLLTFHPVTLEKDLGLGQLKVILEAVEVAAEESPLRLFITGANSDPGNRSITEALAAFHAKHSDWTSLHTSLGQLRYLNLMRHVNGVLGNSSSGILEAPTFGTWTIDVGNRQAGRLSGPSVLHCEPQLGEIEAAIARTASPPSMVFANPYGDGHSSAKIIGVIESLPDAEELTAKRFQDLEFPP